MFISNTWLVFSKINIVCFLTINDEIRDISFQDFLQKANFGFNANFPKIARFLKHSQNTMQHTFFLFTETSPQNSPTRSWQFNAQLQSLAHQVVSYHFCQAENAPTCSVPEFIHSMASQLSQSPLLKPYYQLLVSNHKIRSRLTMEECLANPDDSFVMGIIEPLRSVTWQFSDESGTTYL